MSHTLEASMATPSLARKLGWRWLGKRKDILRVGVAVIVATLIIGMTISEGKRRGMHHAVTVSSGEQIAIAIALSETVYGVKLGYVGLTSVLNALQEHWNKGANGWSDLSVLTANFHSRQVLNDGIDAAASLGPQKIGYFTDGSLITTIYDDMGQVDFYRISFAIFGRKIESAFNTYFLLLGLSAVTVILTFRDNVYALGALLCMLFAFYIELYLANFDQVATPTFFGMRHSSTLGLIPMWYFALLLVFPRKLSPTLLAGAVVQLGILILAWRIRGSVMWMLMFLLVVAAVLAVVRCWPVRSEHGLVRTDKALAHSWSSVIRSCFSFGRFWPLLLRDTLRWPVVLVLLGMLANAVYNEQSRHLIYSTDDVIPHHGLWTSGVNAFYAQMPEVFEPRVKNTSGTPEGWWHLRDYFDRIHLIPWKGTYDMSDPVPGLLSPWSRGDVEYVKYRLVDEAMKRIHFEAISSHPLLSLRFYFIDQPSRMTEQLLMAFISQKDITWLWLILIGSAGIFSFVLLFGDGSGFAPLGKLSLLSASAVVASWLPTLWARATWPRIPDTILLSMCFMSLALGLGAYRLFRCGRLR
jgi:hypothetical protein